MTSSTETHWHSALPVADLAPGSMAVWKHADQQYVIGQTDEQEFFALDNRCPHEGYPLTSGDLKGCALTCCWHNWKFNVRDGSCSLGEEGVRAFPVRVREGVVELDLTEPDPTEAWPGLLESFDEGLLKHQVARSARDGVRLLKAGYDPHRLLSRIARYDARHGEYGTTHAVAVAADCGRFLERYTGLEGMIAIAPAVDMCGESNLRLPARPRPDSIRGATLEELRKAVEEEQVDRALGLLRGAFDDGRSSAEIEHWMYSVLAEHFLNFGHPLIYMVKLQELLQRAGDEDAEEIYEGLLYMVCLGTREDTLPYMTGYFRRFDEFVAQQGANWAPMREGIRDEHQAATEHLRDEVLDGTLKGAVEALLDALKSGASLQQLSGALVAASAHRLLRFDLTIDTDSSVSESWLWATHRMTTASAVRNAVLRYDETNAVRFLIQAVAFIHSGRGMDLAPAERFSPEPSQASVDDVLAAVVAKQPAVAMSGAMGLIEDSAKRRALQHALEDLCLSDPLVRPIVVAHAIKTLVVAFEEYDAQAGTPDQATPLLATLRFLSSPVQERRVREAVERSIQWVGEGIMPRKLTQ